MSAEEIELKLLQDYLDAAVKSNDPQELAQRIAVYEKQLLSCKQQGFDFNWPWLDSMVYYLKAQHKLLNQGFMEKTLRSTVQQSSGFEGIAPALLARGRENNRAREAINLLTQAIQLYEDPDYRFLRANLYHALGDKQSALKDVKYLLATAGDDQNLYLEARKLKDEIETTNANGGCLASLIFIFFTISTIGVGISYLLA
jgi:tetratricopeptide (TPR) repeat protein